MSDFNSVSGHQAQQNTIPAANADAASWRQVFKRAMEQSTFRQGWSHSRRTPRIPMQSLLSRKALVLTLSFVFLGSLIVFAIIRFAASPVNVKKVRSTVASSKSLLSLPRTAIPKPAPGKPFVPQTQSHLPIPTVWTPAPQSQQSPWVAATPQTSPQTSPQNSSQTPAVAPQAPSQMGSTAPARPAFPAGSSFTPLVYQARHEKHFGGSCSGRLTLNAAGLVFDCSDDPSGSVQVALNEIGSVDENGVQLLSGKKYHFSIPGMSKSAEQTLFANWLHQVR